MSTWPPVTHQDVQDEVQVHRNQLATGLYRTTLPVTSVSGAFVETFPRFATATGIALVSGTPRLVAISLRAGEVVNQLSFIAGSGSSGLTHGWAALADVTGTILATSADDTTAWANGAVRTYALAASYTVPTAGIYYIVLCAVASTAPNLVTAAGNVNLVSQLLPMTAAQGPAGASGPPTVGSSLGTLTGTTNVTYAAVS